MRTTLNLDDDVVEAARALARAECRPLGDVVSELARSGLAARYARIGEEDGLPVFRVGPGAAAITPDMVKAALAP